MSNNEDKPCSEADAEIEREIRRRRQFNLADAIGRMAGPGAMKGTSPVPRMHQAAVEIQDWLRHQMSAGDEELQIVLNRWIAGSELLLNGFEQPLAALAAFCQQVLDSDYQLKELVRQADVEWGQMQGERPYFEKEGSQPNPDDPYTIQSVRSVLSGLLAQLAFARS